MASKVFISWSGGKESSLCLYRAQIDGLIPSCLLNMTDEKARSSRTHGLAQKVLLLQAKAIGLPLVQEKTTWEDYEKNFKGLIRKLKETGIEGGVFGDIDLEGHRTWVKTACKDKGLEAHLPLWGKKQEEILTEFVGLGFKAVVVTTKRGILGPDWIGREIDRRFITDIVNLSSVTPCGELGEYHTLVTDGPTFRKKMRLLKVGISQKETHCFLNIIRCTLEDK